MFNARFKTKEEYDAWLKDEIAKGVIKSREFYRDMNQRMVAKQDDQGYFYSSIHAKFGFCYGKVRRKGCKWYSWDDPGVLFGCPFQALAYSMRRDFRHKYRFVPNDIDAQLANLARFTADRVATGELVFAG